MATKDKIFTSKDGEILHMLNPIDIDIVKRSDVDETGKRALAE